MPEDAGGELESGWLLEPPAPDQVHLYIAVGPDVELSPEARGALETLMSALQEEEVAGFDFAGAFEAVDCAGLRKCTPYGACTRLYKKPNCYVLVTCAIAGT